MNKTTALLPGYRKNFNTMLRAAKADDLCLMSAIRNSDGAPVALICAAQRNDDKSISLIPFAVMIEGNPYDLYTPPEL